MSNTGGASDRRPAEPITVYSDYVCPFCYLGRKSLEQYQERRDEPLEIDWHPFDLRAGKRGPDVAEAKKSGALTGFSAHDQDEAQRAAHDDADYVSFSPVFPTTSKPDHPSAGLAALRNVCAGVSIPVLALGGLTPERVAGCLDAGAHGVAVLSGILHADDPAGATAKYLCKLDNPK